MSIRSKAAVLLAAYLCICPLALRADGVANGSLSGAAGGGLAGNYPNPTVQSVPSTALPTGLSGVLGSLRAANFNTTSDQPITIQARVTAFQITKITVTNCSGSLTLAAGGFYPSASKGGTPIVAAGQAYSSLSVLTVILNPTIASNPRMTAGPIYLSLTTGAGAAATCDVYVIGDDLT